MTQTVSEWELRIVTEWEVELFSLLCSHRFPNLNLTCKIRL